MGDEEVVGMAAVLLRDVDAAGRENRYLSRRVSPVICSILSSDMPSAVSALVPGVIAPWLG